MIPAHVISTIVTIAGIAMGLGYYPQAFRIWRSKSAHDVSLGTYLMFGLGTGIWLFYGLYMRDIVIILSFLPGAFGSWLVVLLTLAYRTR